MSRADQPGGAGVALATPGFGSHDEPHRGLKCRRRVVFSALGAPVLAALSSSLATSRLLAVPRGEAMDGRAPFAQLPPLTSLPAGDPASPSGMPAAPTRVTSDFSAMPPGAGLPAGWQEQRVGAIPGNRYSLVAEGTQTVLQIDSRQSASSLMHRLPAPLRAARLSWRWRANGWPRIEAPFGQKAGDDFSLRLYLMFDYPLAAVPFAQRLGLRLARALHGEQVPAATLCYVADPRVAAGTHQASPYSARVQVMVLRSSEAPGQWWVEQRDVLTDFQRAFGAEYGAGMPPVAAVALAADTDQGGGEIRAWFSDLQWWLAR